MNFKSSRWFLLAGILLLSACSTPPQVNGEKGQAERHAASASHGGKLPHLELSDELLYQFLLGEVALQRGYPEKAADLYFELARQTRDPRVARRAAQIAYEAGLTERTVAAFKLWLEVEPQSRPARQMLISLLLGVGRMGEARPYLQQLLAAEPGDAEAVFHNLPALMARIPDRNAALRFVRELAQPYPKVPEAHMAVARMALAADQRQEALVEVRQARALRAKWPEAVLFEVHLLQGTQPEEAAALLKEFLVANPDEEEVRMVYARLLLARKHYPEAYDQFSRLQRAHPENAELAFAVAMLSLQMGNYEQAERELQQSLVHGKKDQDTVHYYLGQLSEAKKDTPAALKHYGKVHKGKYAFTARMREAYLTAAAGRLQSGLKMLHRIHARNSEERLQVLLLESEMLRNAKRYRASYGVLRKGMKAFPGNLDLLYTTAIMAEKSGQPAEMERLLRKLIKMQPDNANAYNALGYSFLERNVRLEEGMRLVEKAYQLAPDSAAILDSMGWGHYRLGRLEESLVFLQRAYGSEPDPEIAAHLGEVLWAHGEREKAKQIWSDALKHDPQSEPLRAVMKKFLKQ